MAKMKVHELAKELQKQSKEILAFLQEQGIEAKAPQSTLEEDTVALVRKSFGADTGKTDEKKAAPMKEENAKAQTAPARDQGTEEAPKKKILKIPMMMKMIQVTMSLKRIVKIL